MGILLIIIFLICIYMLIILKSKSKKSFNFRVLSALIGGLIFGGIVQFFFGVASETTNTLVTFSQIFSGIYINLLQLIVVPLILVSITMAIIDAPQGAKVGKKIAQILAILMITVGIAAFIGIMTVQLFQIDGNKIADASSTNQEEVAAREESIKEHQAEMVGMDYSDYITAPISTNFGFLVGSTSTYALSTVLFGAFLGYSVVQLRKRKPEKTESFISFLTSLKEVVLSMVREILKLTPFGIFALMTKFMATSSLASLGELAKFVVATYFAIILMYFVHLLIVTLFGISPVKFVKKSWPAILFGFGSRSSMASMPLNIEGQVEGLGVDEATANLSATLGATIGQNGCAGIYPAMIATMVATMQGKEIGVMFVIGLILVVMVSSFGIAGVGGGATFAAIAVLSIMGLPVALAALLAAVEPLLDMARTALNISDSMVAGVVTAKINNSIKEVE